MSLHNDIFMMSFYFSQVLSSSVPVFHRTDDACYCFSPSCSLVLAFSCIALKRWITSVSDLVYLFGTSRCNVDRNFGDLDNDLGE